MSHDGPVARWKTLAVSAGVAILFLLADGGAAPLWLPVALWSAAALAAGALWHRAPDETTPISMAPAAHIGALMVLSIPAGFCVVMGTSLVGAALWRRDRPAEILAEGGASLLASLGAVAVLFTLGARVSAADLAHEPQGFVTVVGVGLAYLGLHQAAWSARAAIRHATSWRRAWWSCFGKDTGLVTSGALLTVAGLAVFGAETLGLRGLLLSAMPALFVRDGSRRNVELEIAQRRLIKNERLAAKGEMAAEIGHELNNYLAAVSGRAQLLLRKLEGDAHRSIAAEAERVRSLAMSMAELSRGLMEFSHREPRRQAVGVNDVVEKTVDFVKPQRRFRDLEFRLEPDPALPRVEMDPGQIQQVLLILFGKAAEVPGPGPRPVLRVRTSHTADRNVAIDIGTPGAPPRAAVGEEDAEEPAIETVRRILGRHHGRLEVGPDQETAGGYRILLPAA